MGGTPQLGSRPVRFGVFDLSPVSGELRKHGVRVRLQDQPLRLLLCLLETPGEICTREDLIRRIWPEGTFVDYERGLNVAVTRLRQVLGDSADGPRYVETVGRKGYRFIAPVEAAPLPETVRAAGASLAGGTTESPPSAVVEPVPNAHRSRRFWSYTAVLVLGLAAGGATVWWRTRVPSPKPLVRLSVELGQEIPAGEAGTRWALSPDGTLLVVVLQGADGKMRLATRRLDQSQFTLIAGTEDAASPFFSPDGQWIAFFAEGHLKKISVQGGAPITLAEAATAAPGPLGLFPSGSWGDDGNIIAMLNPVAGLSRVPSAGGTPTPVAGLGKGEDEVDNWPQVLPGSEAVLFTRQKADYDTSDIDVFSWRTGARKTVLHGGFLGRYLPSGHIVYIRQSTMRAAPFDLGALSVSGTSQPILEDIGSRLGGWAFDFSETGSLVYLRSENRQLSVFWMDQSGGTSPLRADPGAAYEGLRFSPDGKRLALSMSVDGHQDIWVQELNRGATSRLTALAGVNDTPVWTVDGWNIIFRSVDQPKPGIYGVRTDGLGEPQRLLDLSAGEFPYSISPDGKRLVIWDRREGGRLWIAAVDSRRGSISLGKPEPFLQSRFSPVVPGRLAPVFSADGRWLAYCANESGRLEVYVIPFPGPGGRTRISTDGGKFPIWSRHRRELFFLDLASSKIMRSTYEEKGQSFLAAPPQVWSDKRLLDLGRAQSYDLAPDGKRFAVVLYADGTAERRPATNLAFLLNFFDELNRRVPTRK